MGNRQYDVVILGATGFTGGLVADYFAANVEPGKIRWAIAGRSVDKLEAVKIRLLHQYPDCKSVGVIVCDTNQLKSVEKMTANENDCYHCRTFRALRRQCCKGLCEDRYALL